MALFELWQVCPFILVVADQLFYFSRGRSTKKKQLPSQKKKKTTALPQLK
jgi:hypothetical protein